MIHGQKRHIKRRLTNPTYLKLYQDILAKNGCLEIKTDNQKLFEYTVKEVNNFPLKLKKLALIYIKANIMKLILLQNTKNDLNN